MALFSFSKTNKKGNYRISAFTACLLIAVIFWLLNSLTKTYSHQEEFELVYEKIPFNKQPANPLPKHAQITFEGTGYNLLWLNIKKPFKNLKVSLPQSTAGTFPDKYRVSVAACFAKQYNNSIHSLKLSFTEPDSIHFLFSEKLTKKVPVKLNADISYKSRYSSVNGIELETDSIIISGTEAALLNVKEIETQLLTFRNLSKKITSAAQIINPDPSKIFLDTEEIPFVIEVNEITESKIFVTVLPPASSKKLLLIPSQVTVTYKTTLDNLKKINVSDFIIVTVNSNTAGELIPVVKKHPAFAEVVFIDPPVIKFLEEN